MKKPFTLIDNLTHLIGLLSEFRYVEDLSEGLNKSDRVIYRYIKALEDMGFEIARQNHKKRVLYKIESIPSEFQIRIGELAKLVNS